MGLHPNTTRASGLTVMETLQEASEAGEGEENRVLEHHLQKALGIKNPAPTQADNEAVTIPLTEHLQKLLNIKQNSPMRSPVLQRHHLPLDQPSPMGNTIGNNFQKGADFKGLGSLTKSFIVFPVFQAHPLSLMIRPKIAGLTLK